MIYTSATPRRFRIAKGEECEALRGRLSEQIIRPTGLIDPELIVSVPPITGDDPSGKKSDCGLYGRG